MKTPHEIIADTKDFWMDGKGDDGEGMELGHHNADRIIAAIYASGYAIISTTPEVSSIAENCSRPNTSVLQWDR